MLGILPLGNSVWLLVIIGVLIVAAIVVGILAVIYHMNEAVDRHYDNDDFGVDDERDWNNHVHVLHPYKPPLYDWRPNFYDWEKDD